MLECSWDDDDYNTAVLEQPYACQKEGGGPAATNAPAALGLVAAGMMAIECQKLLAADVDSLLTGRQAMLDLRHHTHYVTKFHRGHCRFDHETWQVEPAEDEPEEITLGQVVRLAAVPIQAECAAGPNSDGPNLAATGRCGSRGSVSQSCNSVTIVSLMRRCRSIWRAEFRRPSDAAPRAANRWSCAGLTCWNGSAVSHSASKILARPLSTLGVEPYDILSVRGPDGVRHFRLAGPASKYPADSRLADRRLPLSKARQFPFHPVPL